MVALYVKRGEQIFGPFSIEQLKTDAQNGQVKSGDAISQSTDGPWTPVEQVKGLVLKGAAAAIVQPTLPPLGPDPSAVDPLGDPLSPITPLPTVHAEQAQSQQQVNAECKKCGREKDVPRYCYHCNWHAWYVPYVARDSRWKPTNWDDNKFLGVVYFLLIAAFCFFISFLFIYR